MTDTITEQDTEVEEQQTPEEPDTQQESSEEPDTFPRDYVERLRKESATYRERAKKAEDYARELHAAHVAATGRLADPSDLEFSEDHLDDIGAMNAAIDDLLDRKPHLASRTPRGDVGQGASGGSTTVDLAGIIRSRA